MHFGTAHLMGHLEFEFTLDQETHLHVDQNKDEQVV